MGAVGRSLCARGSRVGVAERRPAERTRHAAPTSRRTAGRRGPEPADHHGLHRRPTTCWCWRRPPAGCSGWSTARCRARVLDLAVNFGSERGLLGIALHPDFPANPGVYLYWTESTTGADTDVLSATPLLGNRVDRYVWNGSTLTFDHNLIRLRAIQQDAGQPERGNHDGGVLAFGTDGKLYVFVGDVGRRGHLQNLPCGPTATCPGPTVPDDQFGGPQPDNAHLTGVVLRLKDDGTHAHRQPVLRRRSGDRRRGRRQRPEDLLVRSSQQLRHGGRPRVRRGLVAGERRRHLQRAESRRARHQRRLGPDRRPGGADRPVQADRDDVRGTEPAAAALAAHQHRRHASAGPGPPVHASRRHYSDPEFSWKWEVAPGGIGFVEGRGLGPQFDGDLFVGAATTNLAGGYLFHFNLTGNRAKIGVDDPRLRRPGGRQPRQARHHRERDACSSAATSASSPTSRPVPTATSMSCRSPTARSTRSSGAADDTRPHEPQ